MELPFTDTQFFRVFESYNLDVWPVVVALWLATVVSTILLRRGQVGGLPILLAVHWGWSGLVYHAAYFAEINLAARLFAIAFATQAVAFLVAGYWTKSLRFKGTASVWTGAGVCFIVSAIIYPILGMLSGHRWPALPVFAVPCPTVLFTVGVLLLATPPVPRWLYLIPIAWALIGGSAAILLDVKADALLFVAASAAVLRGATSRHPSEQASTA